MTTVYFVRHAEPNYKNHDDVARELSGKGMKDRVLVTDFLMIRFLMPWIVGLTFDDQVCVNIRTYDLFAK